MFLEPEQAYDVLRHLVFLNDPYWSTPDQGEDWHADGSIARPSYIYLRYPGLMVCAVASMVGEDTYYFYQYQTYIRDFPYKESYVNVEFYFSTAQELEDFVRDPLTKDFLRAVKYVQPIGYAFERPQYTDGSKMEGELKDLTIQMLDRFSVERQ